MLTNIIIINGLPASGKTTLAKQLSKDLKISAVYKDKIKEDLFESLNLKVSRDISKELGKKAYDFMFQKLEESLLKNQDLILEANFKPEFDNQKFQKIFSKYSCQLIQVNCIASNQLLFERFRSRSFSRSRHEVHDDSNNLVEWKNFFRNQKFKPLDLESKVFNFCTSKFSKSKYATLLESIEKSMSQI